MPSWDRLPLPQANSPLVSSSNSTSRVEVPACRARASADPASTRRVVDDAAPPASPSTTPAAASPPAKATMPDAQNGTLTPNAVTAVTAKYEPAVTPSVSGEASGLRASDCMSSPATPRAAPTAIPAASRGTREPNSTSVSANTAPLVPCVRCHSDTTTRTTSSARSTPAAGTAPRRGVTPPAGVSRRASVTW